MRTASAQFSLLKHASCCFHEDSVLALGDAVLMRSIRCCPLLFDTECAETFLNHGKSICDCHFFMVSKAVSEWTEQQNEEDINNELWTSQDLKACLDQKFSEWQEQTKQKNKRRRKSTKPKKERNHSVLIRDDTPLTANSSHSYSGPSSSSPAKLHQLCGLLEKVCWPVKRSVEEYCKVSNAKWDIICIVSGFSTDPWSVRSG